MVQPIHAVLVEVLEAHPDALAYLLELQGTPPPGPLVPTAATRSKTFTLERRVDRAYLIGSRRAPLSFVLAEVQIETDDDKRFAWPLYVELARSRHRCEGALVVVTVSPEVRRWIARSVALPTGELGMERRMTPVVVALDEVAPALLLRADRPWLATLAVAGHTRAADAREVAEAAVEITLDAVASQGAAGPGLAAE